MKGRGKILVGIIVGVVISLITLLTVFVILFLIFVGGGSAEIVKDINKYEETITGYHNLKVRFDHVSGGNTTEC